MARELLSEKGINWRERLTEGSCNYCFRKNTKVKSELSI